MSDNFFYNPYHFIPVKKRTDHSRDLKREDFNQDKYEYHTHAQYSNITKSGSPVFNGRIVCRMKTEDPIFIGSHEIESATDKKAKKVAGFTIKGRAAIPSSTLRGMLSSIAEAVSNSALRVLNTERPLSFRKPVTPSLSALGMIVIKKENGNKFYSLRPLSMPTLQGDHRIGYTFPEGQGNYSKMFREARLKIYLDGYDAENKPIGFLIGKQTFTSENNKYYYLKLHKGFYFKDGKLKYHDKLRFPSRDSKQRFVIGQIPTDDSDPISEEELATKPDRDAYTRGLLRVFGKQKREDVPKMKKHELFIPYHVGIDQDESNLFPILNSAIERFNDLADERAEASKKTLNKHPYELLGTKRTKVADISSLRLKDGDVVYFSPTADGDSVAEVSFSSIWRGRVEDDHCNAATVGRFFSEIDKDLLPFNEGRERITPAELLFGFVQAGKNDSQDVQNSFAAKVHISFGYLDDKEDDPFEKTEVTLKILSSPKPPCPAMYFKNAPGSGKYIRKKELSLNRHEPQGRKYYLHRYESDDEPWRSRNPSAHTDQKVRITPLKKGTQFYFHIDFCNLNEWELGLLCYCIRPQSTFFHKIGMGKPIGLGKVAIDPLGIFTIDRQIRYQREPAFLNNNHRYHSFWINTSEDVSKWPDKYKEEKNFATVADINPEFSVDFEGLRDSFVNTIEAIYPDITNALKLLGNPEKIKYPVHTPQIGEVWQLAGPRELTPEEMEQENYRWFVANDEGSGSENPKDKKRKGSKLPIEEDNLIPIDEKTEEIKALRRYKWNG